MMDYVDTKKPVIFLKCKDAVLYYIRKIKNFLRKHPNIAHEFGDILSKTFPLVEIKKSDIPNGLLEKYIAERKMSNLNKDSTSKPKSFSLTASSSEKNERISNSLNVKKFKADKPKNQSEEFNTEEYFEMINEIIKFDSKRQMNSKSTNISFQSLRLNESSIDILYTNPFEMCPIRDINSQFNHDSISKGNHSMLALECENIDLENFNDLGYLDLTLDLYGIDILTTNSVNSDTALNADKLSTTISEQKNGQQCSYNIFKQLEDETNELNFDPSSSDEENCERCN